MDLKNAKLLGGIGAILMFGVLLRKVGVFLSIAGVVLTLIALKEIASKFNKPSIFNNYLIAFVLHVASSIILLFSSIASIISFFFIIFNFRFGIRLGAGFIILLLVLYGLYIVSGYFVKKSFDEIAEVTNISHFRTAGLLIFLGAILLILFGLGGIIVLIGYVFEIIAFFTLPDKIELPQEGSV